MDKRHKIFFIAMAAVFLLLVLRMALLAGSSGIKYRNEAVSLAMHRGKIPAMRGSFYDEKGNKIVWSERTYDLVFMPGHCNRSEYQKLCSKLNAAFPGKLDPGKVPLRKIIIKRTLTADEMIKANALSEEFSALEVVLRWKRVVTTHHEHIGSVRQINGQEVGVSGWEKVFDDHLSGIPGEFEVMLDKHNRWIYSTFRITKPVQNGQDLHFEPNQGNQ